ncbi:MAG: hypothetical protein EBU90_02660 [Proteobacteria bacterium]|nr:hypothetical protein [Pseudomonadota bacterium]NBP13138.1 hypothetical protein [bacterium]
MAITNKSIAGVDLPTYEFLRPSVYYCNANTGGWFSIPGGKRTDMYFYNVNEGPNLLRYDANADIAVRLPYNWRNNNNLTSLAYCNKGYCGLVISAGLSSLNIAAYDGSQQFVGKTIRITKGPGKNQERKILSVSKPVVAERMVLTSVANNQGSNAGTVTLTDTTRAMSANQYEGFEIKVALGTGYGEVRSILYNTNTSVVLADPSLAGIVYNHSTYLATSPAANSVVLIQSSTVTVDKVWDILPTSDSQFEIIDSGGKIHMLNNPVSPFEYFEFDIATQQWDYKTIYGIRTTQFATDWAIAGGVQSEIPSVSALITSASSLFFADSANQYPLNNFNNYQVKIVSGTGTGQIRHIVSTALSGYTIDQRWDITPDQTSVYTINNNDRIVYGIGGTTDSRLYNYHTEYDVWSHHPYVAEYGHVNTACANSSAYEFPIPISTITRVGTVATVTTVRPHMINFVGGTSVLTITGSTDALYNGTFQVTRVDSSATQFTYNMTGTPGANAVFTNTNTTTRIFDMSKNWTTNQWVSSICYIFNTQTNQFPTQRARMITTNDRNSLTFAGALDFTPSNGCRYFIFPLRPMGVDEMEGTADNKLAYGRVTTGALNSVIDASKNWQTNIHVGKRCMIIAGTLAGTEASITANTSNTLTVAVGTTDTSSVYVILGNLPVNNAGILLDYAFNTTVDKGKYLYFNRGGTVPMYGQRYNVATQTWESAGYPTFNSNAPSQNSGGFPYGASNGGQCSVYDGKDRIYFTVGGNARSIHYYDLNTQTHRMAGWYPYASNNNGQTGLRHFGLLDVEGLKFIYMHRGNCTLDQYRFMVTY